MISRDHPNVMISSTYSDLKVHREAVSDALLRLGFFPIGMEYDSSKAGIDIINSSLRMVNRADAYIGIISHRYGGVPVDESRNPNRSSITEIEYRRAVERGIPVFIYLMSDEHPVKKDAVEPMEVYQARLQQLIADVKSRSICATFSSVEELASRVLQSMSDFRMESADLKHPKPQRSLRKKRRILPPQLLAIPTFISGHQFVGRRAELALLDQWAMGTNPVLVIEAIGGEGKSTLSWQWLNEQIRKSNSAFAGFLWYSFYEGGADMAAFAASAYAYVTGLPFENFRGRKVAELGRMLVAALRETPFLLVLDGLERVLVAYHRLDASQTRDDEVATEKDDRACIKPADGELLRQLITANPSRILVTSRLLPTALLNRSGQLLPGVDHKSLGGLHPQDALTMMRSIGIKGDTKTIIQYLTQNFDNHPQIVGIAAGLVKDYVRHPGDFDRWAEDPDAGAALHLSKLDLVQRQTHILASALTGLDPGVRQVLSRIAALGSAVEFETVETLNPYMTPQVRDRLEINLANEISKLEGLRKQFDLLQTQFKDPRYKEYVTQRVPKIKADIKAAELLIPQLEAELLEVKTRQKQERQEALSKLVSALQDLEKRGLLQWDREKNTYDLHPVVRGYAFDVLEQPERKSICDRIADHFRSKPKDRFAETKTLADVQQSLNIFRALVQGGRFVDAMWFYRGDFANALSYGVEGYHEILALLRPLFPYGFSVPPDGFSTYEQSYLLNNAAVALIMVGRLSEAREALTVKLRLNLETKDRQNLRICLTNLGETLRDENRLAEAHSAFDLALQLARVGNHPEEAARGYFHLMTTYRIIGEFIKAHLAHSQFCLLPIPVDREIYRQGDVEAEYCWLSFYQGALSSTKLDEAIAVAENGNNRPAVRGLFRLQGELALLQGHYDESITAFEKAIEITQVVGLDVSSLEARLALAKIRLGQTERAMEICERLNDLENVPQVELALPYFELGWRDRARDYALAGYQKSWANGPPYSRWWELNQCRNVLTLLGEPEPQLPTLDANGVPRLPYEEKIKEFITELKWEKGH
jgi:tetratricopeptide (TPR) repeat protein